MMLSYQHKPLNSLCQLLSVQTVTYLFQVADALLAYNEGTTPDFLLVELVAGQLRVGVDDGSGNATWRGSDRLDDDQWHLVELRQHGQKSFSVVVDNNATGTLDVRNQPDRRNVFDLFGPLYVGGLAAHMLQSRRPHGLADVNRFVGCLATLTVSGELEDPRADLPPSAVTGCRSERSSRFVTITRTHVRSKSEELPKNRNWAEN